MLGQNTSLHQRLRLSHTTWEIPANSYRSQLANPELTVIAVGGDGDGLGIGAGHLSILVDAILTSPTYCMITSLRTDKGTGLADPS